MSQEPLSEGPDLGLDRAGDLARADERGHQLDPMTAHAFSRTYRFFSAVFMPIETTSSWSAAAAIDTVLVGDDGIRCSTIGVSAVYRLGIMPE